ncbi:hypothetical protein J2Y69_002114 [Microbacterium resistens]|uniref:Transposase n=1 Tax=Microbacterium resistens TaxID=156977 RepID=A0ABU1SD31_9MICO|nr:hypothetical protein [Microbacterium resistens]MDR6867510.1 hypothetical protein [Microbacterium resistens]
MNLRVVRDETPALSDAELRERGNDLAAQARRAAIDAVRESMVSEFLARGQSLTVPALRRWRERATLAREAWARVEALTDELIREVEKNRAAKRAVKQRDADGSTER